jgi:hypothetical protein
VSIEKVLDVIESSFASPRPVPDDIKVHIKHIILFLSNTWLMLYYSQIICSIISCVRSTYTVCLYVSQPTNFPQELVPLMLKCLSKELSFKLRAVLVTTTSTTTTTTPRTTANPALTTTTFHLNAEKVSCRQSMH